MWKKTTKVYLKLLARATKQKVFKSIQAFWQGARVRGRTIRSKPHNPAQFMKTREIPHNMERFD